MRIGTEHARFDDIALRCALFTSRRLARAMTRHFDAHLEPSGLRGTQYNVLVAIARAPHAGLTELGQRLGLDRTALTHALRPLQRASLVAVQPGGDRRRREFVLTPAGKQRISAAIPLWRKAQRSAERSVRRSCADLDWAALNPALRRLSRQLDADLEEERSRHTRRGG